MASYPYVPPHGVWPCTYIDLSTINAETDSQHPSLYGSSGEPAASFGAGNLPSRQHLTGYAESRYVPIETTVAGHSLHDNNPVLNAGSQGVVTSHLYATPIAAPSQGYGDAVSGSSEQNTQLVSQYSGPIKNGWVNYTNNDFRPGSITFRQDGQRVTFDHTEIAHRLDAARSGNAFDPPLPAQRPARLEYSPLNPSDSAYTIAQSHLFEAGRCSWSRTSATGGMTDCMAPKTAGTNGTCSAHAGQALSGTHTEDPTTLTWNEPPEAAVQPAQNVDSLAWYRDYLRRPEVQQAMDHNRHACAGCDFCGEAVPRY